MFFSKINFFSTFFSDDFHLTISTFSQNFDFSQLLSYDSDSRNFNFFFLRIMKYILTFFSRFVFSLIESYLAILFFTCYFDFISYSSELISHNFYFFLKILNYFCYLEFFSHKCIFQVCISQIKSLKFLLLLQEKRKKKKKKGNAF